MNENILTVCVEEGINSEVLGHIQDSLSVFGDDVEIKVVPDQGPQASIVLFVMTSVVALFTTAFVAKLGHKAAEDAYPHIKEALSKVYKNYFGKNPKYKKNIVVSSNAKHKAIETKYSLIFSFLYSGPGVVPVKFLFETEWSEAEFNAATEKYLHAMQRHIEGDSEGIAKLIAESQRPEQNPQLIAIDSDTKELIVLDAFPKLKDDKI